MSYILRGHRTFNEASTMTQTVLRQATVVDPTRRSGVEGFGGRGIPTCVLRTFYPRQTEKDPSSRYKSRLRVSRTLTSTPHDTRQSHPGGGSDPRPRVYMSVPSLPGPSSSRTGVEWIRPRRGGGEAGWGPDHRSRQRRSVGTTWVGGEGSEGRGRRDRRRRRV